MLVCTSLRDAGSEGLEEPPKLVNATMQAPPALGIDVQTLFAVSALVDQLHEQPGRSNQHLDSHGRKQAVIGLFFLVKSLQLVMLIVRVLRFLSQLQSESCAAETRSRKFQLKS